MVIKIRLVLVFLFFFFNKLTAQPIFFIERDTKKNANYVVQLGDDIKKWKFDECMNYDVLGKKELVLWKLYSFEKLTINTRSTKIFIADQRPEILDFDLVNNKIYYMQSDETFRLDPNTCKLNIFNCENGEVRKVEKFASGINFSNMDVSPSERFIAFIHKERKGDDQWQGYLMLYDFISGDTIKICESHRMVDDIEFKATCWVGDSILMFKENYWMPDNERQKRFRGVINSFSLPSQELQRELVVIDEGIKSFDILDDKVYLITKTEKIYRVYGSNKELLYAHGKDGYIHKIKVGN